MLVWMVYGTVVGAVFGLAGVCAERGLRRLGRPVRWVWGAVMAATVLVPLSALAEARVGVPSAGATAPGSGLDTLVLAGWVAVTLVLLASLRMSAWTLRRNARSWRRESAEGGRVLWSTAFGPGVIGARAPTVVLPGWVEELPDRLRRLVVGHEVEHVRAGDTRLLLAGVVLTALVPWCLPLWWQLHRLRAAIETDCDARVLAAGADPRAYANALVAIAGRPTRRWLPVPTLAPRPAELEARIRLITGGSRRGGPGLLGLAVVAALAFAAVPAPNAPPEPLLPTLRWAPPAIPPELPREAKVFLSVQPEPDTGG